ncbi:hypothetical protein RFI_33687, partial [Reticulomyxa filosa]
GICKEDSCVAGKKKEPVVCCRGFGQIRPNEDMDGSNPDTDKFPGIVCPGCKKPFEIDNFFLYRCNVVVKYRTKKDKEIQTVTEKVAEEKVWRLGGEGNDTGKEEYTSLVFNVSPL